MMLMVISMMLLVNLKGVHVISRMCDVDNIHIDNHDGHEELWNASRDIYGIFSILQLIVIGYSHKVSYI